MTDTNKCKITGKSFQIHDKELAIAQRLGFPLPEIAPQERLRQLMATRNEWKLYPRKCDATGKDILSAYAPDSPFKVYTNSVWWGDTWDALEYGREFDFTKSFFEQYAALQKVVPREGTSVFNSENCDYNSHIRESRNCYLNSLVARCEDMYYSYWMVDDKDTMDSMYTNKSTLCYECSDVNNGYQCVALQESNNCNECYFSYQLRGCDHCLFSTNLVNKSYYLFNKPCSKEEFEAAKQKYLNGSWKTWQEAYQQFLQMRSETVHRAVHTLNCENCSGDHLYDCKNCVDSFEGFGCEDAYNVVSMAQSKDVYNVYSAGWPGCEVIYECCVMRGSTDAAFCTYTWFSNEMRYADSCVSCKNCFGCIGLRHKQYCILNRQYTKEEYEALLPKIIEHMKKNGEWGQFFPPQLSPFAYNETAAHDLMPLAKEQALKIGWRWREENKKDYKPATIKDIPDAIKDVADSITKETLVCGECGKNYRIIPQELALYRKMNLPLPRSCPDCRNKRRLNMRNSYELHERKCSKCDTTVKTTYAPERQEKIYCEKCYLAVVD